MSTSLGPAQIPGKRQACISKAHFVYYLAASMLDDFRSSCGIRRVTFASDMAFVADSDALLQFDLGILQDVVSIGTVSLLASGNVERGSLKNQPAHGLGMPVG